MEPCIHRDLIESWKKQIPEINKWIWKASGVVAAVLFLFGFVGKMYIGSIVGAQQEADAKVVAEQAKNETQDKEIQKNKNDITGIKKDIEYIKESQERQEKNDEKILDAIKDLKKNE